MCVRFVLVFHFASFRGSKSVAASLAVLALESVAAASSEGCSESNLWVMRQLSPTIQPHSRAASVLSHLSSDFSPLPIIIIIFFYPFLLSSYFVHRKMMFNWIPKTRKKNLKQANYLKVKLHNESNHGCNATLWFARTCWFCRKMEMQLFNFGCTQ